jgi:cell wall-associated NlpC family hydrolase
VPVPRCTIRHNPPITLRTMLRLTFALLVSTGLAACASTGAVPRPFPTPGGPPPVAAAAPPDDTGVAPKPPSSRPGATVDGYSISSTALALRGAPYRNGGTDPGGFDCSGFVKYVFEQNGVAMPRDVRRQFEVGMTIDAAAVLPGDLLFFTTVAPGASHVGIAVGGDQFVHAPSTTGVVRVEHLSSQYWSSRFVGAKRVN